MKFWLAVGAAWLAMTASGAQASARDQGKERLTFADSRSAILDWSARRGSTEREIRRCHREDRTHVRCVLIDGGWVMIPGDPAATDPYQPTVYANDMWQKMRATLRRNGSVRVNFIDWVWIDCPGNPRCP